MWSARKDLRGRLLTAVVGIAGKSVLGKALANTARAIEARHRTGPAETA